MFYYLEGKLVILEQNTAVIDCHGIAFACTVSLNTMSRLETGSTVRLYTYYNVREDGVDLFGFYDLNEKRSFEMLLGVSGVGPKAAVSILSAVSPEGLALAVLNEDEKAITAAQGVGKKIAQRIILELRDKISKESVSFSGAKPAAVPGASAGTKASDAAAALVVLGFTQTEANAILRTMDLDAMTLEEIVKEALKRSQ